MHIPRLKHLELQIGGFDDLVNGHRWQKLASQLITFNFNLFILSNHYLENFNTFCTPFWLKEKR